MPGFQVLQNRILPLLCTSDVGRMGGRERGRYQGHMYVLTMCTGFGGGDSQKCLDAENLFLEEGTISTLHTFLIGGYFCAKSD